MAPRRSKDQKKQQAEAKPKPGDPLDVNALAKAASVFVNESDRGVALIATAWLDDVLEKLIRTGFRSEDKIADSVLKDTGGLSTFSARIKVAYLMGLLEKSAYLDLNIIRKIRNDFAHFRKPITFEDENISDRCTNLRTIIEFNKLASEPARSTRQEFLVASFVLIRYLLSLVSNRKSANFVASKIEVDSHGIFVQHFAALQHLSMLYESFGHASNDDTA
jgi:DNA-binding MltR family transcriptional regulator